MNAIDALAKMPDERVIKTLIAKLEDRDLKNDATRALRRIKYENKSHGPVSFAFLENDESVKALPIEAFEDTNPKVRCQAAEILGRKKDARAVDALIEAAISDEWAQTRSNSAYALGRIDDPRTPAILFAMLDSDAPEVRARVVEALGKLKCPKAVDALAASLAKSDDEYLRVRQTNVQDPGISILQKRLVGVESGRVDPPP